MNESLLQVTPCMLQTKPYTGGIESHSALHDVLSKLYLSFSFLLFVNVRQRHKTYKILFRIIYITQKKKFNFTILNYFLYF